MKIYLSIVLLFTINLIFSQQTVTNETDWSVVIEKEGVLKISKRSIAIDDTKNGISKAYFQYKFENHSNKQLFLNWNFITEYENFSSSTKKTNENYRALLLEPEQILIPEYSNSKEKNLFVFKRFLKRPTKVLLKSVKFHELKFTTL